MDGQKLTKQSLDRIHQGKTEYLKSIPNGSKNNNLQNLPSVSPQG